MDINQRKALVSQELIRAKAGSSRDVDSEEEMKILAERLGWLQTLCISERRYLKI